MAVQTHGVTPEAYKRFVVDAGAAYLDYGLPTERLLGATRGGSSLAIAGEIRAMPVDGVKGPVMGMQRRVEAVPRLTVNLLELSVENFRLALAGAVSAAFPAAPATKTHDAITRSRDLALTDYLDNVALVGRRMDTNQPAIFLLYNALATNEPELTFNDRDEAVLQVVFTGHYDPAAPDQEPWEIRVPVEV